MLDQEGLVDSFFLAAVETVCRPYGYKMGREIIVGPNRTVCINDPEMTEETRTEIGIALDDAVGGMC
jgi:hypothetical protein